MSDGYLLPEIFLQSCAMYKTHNGSSRGSGFLIKLSQKVFFITAKHVVYLSNGQFCEELANLYIFSLGSGFLPELLLDLKSLQASGHIKTLGQEVVSIEMAQLDVEDPNQLTYSEGVTLNSATIMKPKCLTAEDLDLDESVKTVSPVYLIGFPSTAFRPASGPLNQDYPLVRHGIVAGIHNNNLILDCACYLGNSGGLAVAKLDDRFKAVGIINEFVPFVEELSSKQYPGPTMMTRYENTGLSIAMKIRPDLFSVLSSSLERMRLF
jgi:hypothetical protein